MTTDPIRAMFAGNLACVAVGLETPLDLAEFGAQVRKAEVQPVEAQAAKAFRDDEAPARAKTLRGELELARQQLSAVDAEAAELRGRWDSEGGATALATVAAEGTKLAERRAGLASVVERLEALSAEADRKAVQTQAAVRRQLAERRIDALERRRQELAAALYKAAGDILGELLAVDAAVRLLGELRDQ
jgi:hypothetical protein